VVVLATDAPLNSRQLGRLCGRAAAGIARTGGHYGHSSGDFAIAFSTAQRIEHRPPALTATRKILADEARGIEALFVAAVECVEEAILNSLSSAQTMTGRDNNTAYGLPLDELAALVAGWNF
jgi:D-aminopeptidase